jgi:hypothetical protein
MRILRLSAWLLWAGVTACGSTQKQQVIDKTLDTMSAEQRRGTFEDMAKVLDGHPDWVDEFYAVARPHPLLMQRFLTNATRDLQDPKLAAVTADLLARSPPSLEQVLVQTVDKVQSDRKARAAMNRAVAARAESMADILTDSGPTMDAVLAALVAVAAKKPEARDKLLHGVDKEAPRMVELVANNPKLLSAMTRSILEAASKDKASLAKLLKELHVL